jgi:TonB family protein
VLAPEDESRALDALRFSLAGDIVELVVLTTDDAFLQTLRDAGDPTHRLWHVLSPDKVSDLLLAGGVGILVLDVHALNEAPSRFIVEIKRQFPDLVVVVAGHREAETELARLISAGSVYRFIHKPVSPARAHLFAEAAVRRYEEQRRRADSSPAPAPAGPRKRAPLLVGAGCAAGCVLLVSLWLARRSAHEETTPAADASREPQAPIAPASSALEDPREQSLARAENALLEDRFDEAAGAIEAARKAGATGSRLAFLSTQLAKARDQARSAAALARAKADAATLASAPPVPLAAAGSANPMPEPGSAPDTPPAAHEPATGVAAQDTQPGAAGREADATAAERWAALAMQRIQADRLVEPYEDSARFYIRQALAADHDNAAVQEAEQALALKLLEAAHGAIDRRDFARAASWIDAADGIASPSNVENLRGSLAAARARGTDEAADHPQAVAAGSSSSGTEGPARDTTAAVDRQSAPSTIIDASQLEAVKHVNPTYPVKAEKGGIEGWVELDLTITEAGGVEDVTVHAAKPAGVFDQAAVAALSQWRYKPVLRDSKPVATRARIRIRFALPR